MLTARGVTAGYAGRIIVEDVSLSVAPIRLSTPGSTSQRDC